MGYKSRGSWNINFCMKSDCRVRGYGIAISGVGTTGKSVCNECIRYSNYEKIQPKEEQDERKY
jgi:hypothetical protein